MARLIGFLTLVLASPVWGQALPAPESMSAWRIYVDPESGRVTAPPAEESSPRSADPPFEGVTISRGVSAAGGIKVRLGRRGLHAIEAESAEGQTGFRCAPR